MIDQRSIVLANEELTAGYRRIVFRAPDIAAEAAPGQFVHVQIPTLRDRILRRPFSICSVDVSAGTVTVVFKVVGQGTGELARVAAGTGMQILGPLGKGYTLRQDAVPLLITGGYGSASTLFLAERAAKKGIVLMGARTEQDLILREEYAALGFDVRVATNDGSCGVKGFVTELIPQALADAGNPVIYACGPKPMLYAVGRQMLSTDVETQLSLDQNMCCGVGACFACVIKVNDAGSPDGFRYARTCSEGPVFFAGEVYYE
ncbi:MAG: dihydroorotate dehydrogenase electron transfer subunit [Lentisphaeria bacterium]|nr:dihydroorotate dehydrogenase electron transfer subunit [Lentisphaeria bacterium]